MKIRGIKIKAVGLNEKEMKNLEDAMRRIKYGRKQDNRPFLPHLVEIK